MATILHIAPDLDASIEVVGGNETDGSAEYHFSVFDPKLGSEPLFEMGLEPLWYLGDLHTQMKFALHRPHQAAIAHCRRQFEPGDYHQHTLMRQVDQTGYPSGFSFTRTLHEALIVQSTQIPWLRNIYSSAFPGVPWEGGFSLQGQKTWQKYIDENHPRVAWIQSLNRFRLSIR